MLDVCYEQYVTRKGGVTKQARKRLRIANPDADTDLLEVSLSHSLCLHDNLLHYDL